MQTLYFILGCVFLVVGILGVILPVMPGTVFLLLAAGFFAKSSPRVENWLVNHPKLGPPIVSWRRNGSMRMRYKIIAIGSMWAGITYTLISAPWYVGCGMALLGAWATWFIVTRPTEPEPLAQ